MENEPFQAICVAGERNCPPEDRGGAHGFAEMLDILRNPSHPRNDEALEWIGDDFDPEYFDLEKGNQRLRSVKR